MQALQNLSEEEKMIMKYTIVRVRDEAVRRLDEYISGKIPAIDIANKALKAKNFVSGLKKISDFSKVKKVYLRLK